MLFTNVYSCVLLPLFLSLCQAIEQQEPLHEDARQTQHNVAIIGAGAAGSSASYYLDKFARESPFDLPIHITIFDSNQRPGGRATTVNALDDPRFPTELGASIFVRINEILVNATKELGLRTSSKIYRSASDSKFELGIWDGTDFVFKVAAGNGSGPWRGWWDVAKMLWKYGLAPIRTSLATKAAVSKFLQFYQKPLFPFESLQEAVDSVELGNYTGVAGKTVLKEANVGDLFAREVVQASTRVNYASNLGGIHGLETLVCMAIEGGMSVEGGNWQIFDQMIKKSGSSIRLKNTVTEVSKKDNKFWLQTNSSGASDATTSYDSVVVAAPYQFANLSFRPELSKKPITVDYVTLHVTLLTSPHRLSPSFFNLTDESEVPSSVLTTLPEGLDEALSALRGVDAVGPANFWSISTLDIIEPDSDSEQDEPSPSQFLYKIFSPSRLTAKFLSDLLDISYNPAQSSVDSSDFADPITNLPKGDLTWSFEKVWHSYPYEIPRTEFGDFKLDDGLFYTGLMDPFISSMETNALAGMNVAKLIIEELEQKARGAAGTDQAAKEDGDWVLVDP